MEVIITKLFSAQLDKCPIEFLTEFRKIYQQLKIVDSPTEIKGIVTVKGKDNFFKLTIDKSRIGLEVENDKLYISCFFYNQYFNLGR
jgi:mRNA-degrading endonuclease RelE of RelBE toxin-antitoxin system